MTETLLDAIRRIEMLTQSRLEDLNISSRTFCRNKGTNYIERRNNHIIEISLVNQ